MRDLSENQRDEDEDEEDDFNSNIIVTDRGFCTVSLFDDYAYRGPHIADYCLYDYCAQFYKRRKQNGLLFDDNHPQHAHYNQFLRHDPVTVPTFLGRFLFVTPDSEDEKKRDDYYCLFFPWSHKRTPKSSEETWQQFIESNRHNLSPRIRRVIHNLTLLHKSKEETRIHQMQLRAQEEGSDADSADIDDRSTIASDDSFDHCSEFGDDDDVDFSAEIEDAINSSIETGLDFDSREGLDAFRNNGYSTTDSSVPLHFIPHDVNDVYPFRLSLSDLQIQTELLAKAASRARQQASTIHSSIQDRPPHVFLTDGTDDEPALMDIVHRYTLNKAQELAFRIIASHTLGNSKVGPQLRMGLFGEGGTGKSRLITAVRAWFAVLNRENEIMVTASTGTAAFNIGGSTLHSAANLPIGNKPAKAMSNDNGKRWNNRHYLIVDEISMMDCKNMEDLNITLGSKKSCRDSYFGGVNVIFMGDFLQLPTVSHYDLYIDKPSKYEWGHHLWRSLNAVVNLTEQMRQSDDPEFAAALRRIRLHQPTPNDIELLNSRVCAPLESPTSIPIVVRRHNLRDAINKERLNESSRTSNLRITHCLAKITNRRKMSLPDVYNLKGGRSAIKADGILSVIPGAPLMITKNIKTPLGIFERCLKLNCNRPCKRCNRRILRFRE